MKNLIPLSDFVLEQRKKTTSETDYAKVLKLIFNYTEFLKQPLKLEMFVPCDEKGNVLKEQAIYCFANKGSKHFEKHTKYWEAKEKVLFEGFEFVKYKEGEIIGYVKEQKYGEVFSFPNHKGFTVEDLISSSITLTPSALNKIGIKE